MNLLTENIIQAIEDFNDIHSSLEEKNVLIPNNTPTSEYGNLIRGLDVSSDRINNFNVKFIDYDGTILKELIVSPGTDITSYVPNVTNKEATNLRPALTFRGWNFTTAQMSNVQWDMIIGAIYIPSDGKTHLYLSITPNTYQIPLYFYKTTTALMTVDFGDGTNITSTSSGGVTVTTNYTTPGLKHITIEGTAIQYGGIVGSVDLHKRTPVRCYIGLGITHLQGSSFYKNWLLKYLTIPDTGIQYVNNPFPESGIECLILPNGITSLYSYFCNGNMNLKIVSLPFSITTINSSAFQNDFGLQYIILPPSITVLNGNTFQNCFSLKDLRIPTGITSIGGTCFNNCYSLTSIILPSTCKVIAGSAFQFCTGLKDIKILGNLTTAASYALHSCYAAQNIEVPINQKVCENAFFYDCYTVRTPLIIPEGCITLGASFAYHNYNREYVDVASTVTSIGDNCFRFHRSTKYFIFRSTTPPTMSSISAMADQTDTIPIFVPDASVDAYKAATNWSTYANRIRPLSEFNINNF